MSKKNEVAVAQEHAVAASPNLGEWGQPEAVEISDVVIPKVLVMQKMSDLVDEGKAGEGDFVDSVSKKKLGSITEPLEFIPFKMEKLWFISKKVATRFELQQIIPYDPSNSTLRYSEVINGEEWKRELHMRFYSILPSDPVLPYIITFKSTSQKYGKALYTQMYVKNAASNISPAGYVMTLYGTKEANDQGKFIVPNFGVARKATPEEEGHCLNWFKTLKSVAHSVDESSEKVEKNYAPENTQF